MTKPITFEVFALTPYATAPQNGQAHSNNLSETTDELFECV